MKTPGRILFAALAALLIASPLHADNVTKINYTVEVSEVKGTPRAVILMFYSDVTPDQALENLKIQLAAAIRFTKDNEIMAFAFRSGKSKGEERAVFLPDGSSCLVFRNGQYLTGKQAGIP